MEKCRHFHVEFHVVSIILIHGNATFAVTGKDKDVKVYINVTKYTLTPYNNKFKVNKELVGLSCKQKHVNQVRKVETDGHQYVHPSQCLGPS